jgi:hypothetical protein
MMRRHSRRVIPGNGLSFAARQSDAVRLGLNHVDSAFPPHQSDRDYAAHSQLASRNMARRSSCASTVRLDESVLCANDGGISGFVATTGQPVYDRQGVVVGVGQEQFHLNKLGQFCRLPVLRESMGAFPERFLAFGTRVYDQDQSAFCR